MVVDGELMAIGGGQAAPPWIKRGFLEVPAAIWGLARTKHRWLHHDTKGERTSLPLGSSTPRPSHSPIPVLPGRDRQGPPVLNELTLSCFPAYPFMTAPGHGSFYSLL